MRLSTNLGSVAALCSLFVRGIQCVVDGYSGGAFSNGGRGRLRTLEICDVAKG